MRNVFNKIWRAPRAPGAKGPARRDWVLVSLMVLMALIEGFVTDNVIWRPLTILLSVGIALTLPWRRTHPLVMALIGFGLSAIIQMIALLIDIDWRGLNCNILVVIFPYALLRWGSGREAMFGLIAIALSIVPVMSVEQHSWLEILGASMFILIPAALGLTVRYQDTTHRIVNEQIRQREREQLARELHDTVAHHVSAIAIQAQAGKALATTQPDAPLRILNIIEEAASKTLIEMRQIVTSLRDDSPGVQAPVATLTDIKRLAQDSSIPLKVNVEFDGDLTQLSSTVEATLFRLAQESVTNAVRHAKHANRIDVQVSGEAEQVRLTVSDDGDSVSHYPNVGLGLRGMAERVSLLGGRFSAAPGTHKGWIVSASLPKFGSEDIA